MTATHIESKRKKVSLRETLENEAKKKSGTNLTEDEAKHNQRTLRFKF